MKLDDFLKCKKVRCVSIGNHNFITVGKEYDVVGVDRDSVFIVNDNDSEDVYLYKHFEPVLDQAENPLQGAELTPEFEAVEPVTAPRFQAGQKAYCPWLNEGKLIQLEANRTGCLFAETVKGRQYFNKDGTSVDVSSPAQPDLFHATQANYELLSKLMPWVEFEQPPKPLTGSDLCFEKLRNGKKLVMCAVSDLSDEKAIKRLQDGDNCIRVIKDCDPAPYHFIDAHGIRHGFAVPLNDETGEPLTEAMLDE